MEGRGGAVGWSGGGDDERVDGGRFVARVAVGQQNQPSSGSHGPGRGRQGEIGHLFQVGHAGEREGQPAEIARGPRHLRHAFGGLADLREEPALATAMDDRRLPFRDVGWKFLGRCTAKIGAGAGRRVRWSAVREHDLDATDRDRVAGIESAVGGNRSGGLVRRTTDERAVAALEIPERPPIGGLEDLGVEAARPLVVEHDMVGGSAAKRQPLL